MASSLYFFYENQMMSLLYTVYCRPNSPALNGLVICALENATILPCIIDIPL